jgi:hypothetical protein
MIGRSGTLLRIIWQKTPVEKFSFVSWLATTSKKVSPEIGSLLASMP